VITPEPPNAYTKPRLTREEGIVPTSWDDPELDKLDKEDKRALLSIFVVIIVMSVAAFLLAFFEDLSFVLTRFEEP
jgi:hypothetical protein